MENNMNLTNKQKALAIFKWSLRKYLPMSIAYWILLFISLPMIELFGMIVCISDTSFTDYVEGLKEIASVLSGTLFSSVVILFSIIITIVAFSYMHNKRCVDLFGSFPVSRRTMFFTRYITVNVICIVPIIVFGTIGALLTFSDAAMIDVFKNMGYLILGVVSNISFIAFISVCCGTVADVLISYCLINVIYPICVAICYFFPVSVIPGLQGGYIGMPVFTLFSPLAAPFVGMFGDSKTLHIVWWIAFTVVLVAGCYVLCKKRKAETAQNAFAFAAVEIVIKFVTCFATGFGIGWIFANIGAGYEGIKAQYVWFFIGLVFGIMVSNFLLHLVFHRGLSKYKDSLCECGVVAIATIVFLFIVTTGGFGYDERMPDASEIEEVCMITDKVPRFEVNGKNILTTYKDDKESINKVVELHNNLLDEYEKTKKGIYPIVDNRYDTTYAVEDESQYYSYIELSYKLKNGRTVERGYNTNSIDVKMPDKLESKFEMSEEEILSKIPEKYIYQIEINRKNVPFNCYDFYGVEPQTGNKWQKDSLVKALKKDIEEQGYSKKIGSDGFSITVYFEDATSYNYQDVCIEIPDTYVNTIKVIKDNHLYLTDTEWINDHISIRFTNVEAASMDVKKTIYFKVPETWDAEADIKCMPYNPDWDGFYTELNSDFARCEKVTDDIWKYEIRDIKKTYTEIMFYQESGEVFNLTGCIEIPKKGNMLVLGSEKVNRGVTEYWRTQYDFEWNTYNE